MASSSSSGLSQIPGGVGALEESRRRPRSAPPPLEDAWRQEFQVLERQWEKLRLSAKVFFWTKSGLGVSLQGSEPVPSGAASSFIDRIDVNPVVPCVSRVP